MTKLAPFRALSPFFRRPLWEDYETFWPQLWGGDQDTLARWAPKVEIIERPEAFLIKAEVPGLEAKDIDVNITGDLLTLRGERKKEEEKDTDHYHIREHVYGAFERSFTFPAPVDSQHVEAEIKDGLLTVRVMKKEEGKPAKINV
jgi:HSP20 family protein